MRSPSSGHACPAQLIVACLAALEQGAEGTIPCSPGRHNPAMQARANGLTAGSLNATRTRNLHYRDRVLLPALQPSSRALLRSQGGAHAGAWLSAVPSEPALTLAPQAMQLPLRRRLRLPLPLSPNRCGPSPGCGQQVDEYGDHALTCPRTGLLARRAKIVERAWVRVARVNNGSCAQPHLECRLTTADGST